MADRVPDFSRNRRLLRRSRIEDSLGLERRVNVQLNRDSLLELAAVAADDDGTDFLSLDEDAVDTIVSIALAEVDESASDSLAVALLCLQVLARDGQFARISQLSQRIAEIASYFDVERPFLHLVLVSLVEAIEGRRTVALTRLDTALGAGGVSPRLQASHSRENRSDLVVAVALREWLSTRELRVARTARKLAVRDKQADTLLLLDSVIKVGEAFDEADPSEVLREANSIFDTPRMQEYIRKRGISALFPVQIDSIRAGALADEGMIIGLPTSSGKTLLAELRIAATLESNPGSRIIYVAPYRLLARQVESEVGRGLRPLGFNVRDLGGSYDPTFEGASLDRASGQQVPIPDVAIVTPERLDSLMRLATTSDPGAYAAAALLDETALFVFDELHLVSRTGRGSRFEMLLARMRWSFPSTPILGLCAASHGIDELALWLTEGRSITFDRSRRPTGTIEIVWDNDDVLRQRVRPRPTKVGELARSKQAVNDAASLVLRFKAEYQPILIVETTRPAAENAARRIHASSPAQSGSWRRSLTSEQARTVDEVAEEVRDTLGKDHPLATLVQEGIAYHHAGVPTHLLRQIEFLARSRLLRFLASTTTVAEGADLPFRVVVLPHLNFSSGSSRKLDRDLYLNIIGRAGRANVAVEGIVVLLNSTAPTLSSHIQSSLWADTQRDRIRGRLQEVSGSVSTVEEMTAYQDVQSQVLAWLGEGGSGIDRQSESIMECSLTGATGNIRERSNVVSLFDQCLVELEEKGLARSASPYRLTDTGRRARLTGLSVPSILRLQNALTEARNGLLASLMGAAELSERQCRALARLLLESTEVLTHSLWMKRTARNDADMLTELFLRGEGRRNWPYADEMFETDIILIGLWLQGASYSEIADEAPVFKSTSSLFGGNDPSKRASDAAEYIGKLSYPAAWTWSAVKVLAGVEAERLPDFIRHSIEYGVPSETATRLIGKGMSRRGAIHVASVVGPRWNSDVAELLGETDEETVTNLSTADRVRLSRLIEDFRS